MKMSNGQLVSIILFSLYNLNYLLVDDRQPGPSRRQVRRKTKAAPREIAEIYAKISAIDSKTISAMEDAAALRFGEIQQDINRLESNSETQRKYIGQELERVKLRTQTAVDHAQQQIDSLRQQTTDMHSSLTAIHHQSQTLTDGLKTMMNSFSNLRFDLLNAFNDWMRVRMGEAGTGTVSGSDLRQGPWSLTAEQKHIPLLPPLLPLHHAPPAVTAPSPITPSAPNTEQNRREPGAIIVCTSRKPSPLPK